MKILKRLLANFVDIFLFLAIVVFFFAFVLPSILPVADREEVNSSIALLIAVTSLILVVVSTFAAQYPFLIIHQTIGKAFFRLKIISTNEQRPLTVSIIVQREIFAKVMSLYLLCLPVLFNKTGKHDEACETGVIEV